MGARVTRAWHPLQDRRQPGPSPSGNPQPWPNPPSPHPPACETRQGQDAGLSVRTAGLRSSGLRLGLQHLYGGIALQAALHRDRRRRRAQHLRRRGG